MFKWVCDVLTDLIIKGIAAKYKDDEKIVLIATLYRCNGTLEGLAEAYACKTNETACEALSTLDHVLSEVRDKPLNQVLPHVLGDRDINGKKISDIVNEFVWALTEK